MDKVSSNPFKSTAIYSEEKIKQNLKRNKLFLIYWNTCKFTYLKNFFIFVILKQYLKRNHRWPLKDLRRCHRGKLLHGCTKNNFYYHGTFRNITIAKTQDYSQNPNGARNCSIYMQKPTEKNMTIKSEQYSVFY